MIDTVITILSYIKHLTFGFQQYSILHAHVILYYSSIFFVEFGWGTFGCLPLQLAYTCMLIYICLWYTEMMPSTGTCIVSKCLNGVIKDEEL